MSSISDDEETLEELVTKLIQRSKRVQRTSRIVVFDAKTKECLGITKYKWRANRVPRSAKTRQMLLTGYLHFIVNDPDSPLTPASIHLKAKFPEMRPCDQAGDFFQEFIVERGLTDEYITSSTIEEVLKDKYHMYKDLLEKDDFGDYDKIYAHARLSQGTLGSKAKIYLSSECGLGFLANLFFANAKYAKQLTHNLIWHPEDWLIYGQAALSVFDRPSDLKGHGAAGGMKFKTYGEIEKVSRDLFEQQVLRYYLELIADSSNTYEMVRKQLERAATVLGMRREEGAPSISPGHLCV